MNRRTARDEPEEHHARDDSVLGHRWDDAHAEALASAVSRDPGGDRSHILLLTHDYPIPGANYSAYVQTRADLYRRMGHQVTVITGREHGSYLVTKDSFWLPAIVNHDTLARKPVTLEQISRIPADVCYIHTPLPGPISYVMPAVQAPKLAYIHGSEAMPLSPRVWDLSVLERLWRVFTKPEVLAILDECQAIVTASRWMQGEVTRYVGNHRPFEVIPNPIDPALFPLQPPYSRSPKGVVIRGANKKYGVDLLPKGSGDFDILPATFQRTELSAVLSRYAYLIAPSRVDSQGVLSCEAAATGMPVLTTNVCAIPEFISGYPHILVEPTPEALRDGIQEMKGRRATLTSHAAALARERILGKCGPDATVGRELALMESLT